MQEGVLVRHGDLEVGLGEGRREECFGIGRRRRGIIWVGDFRHEDGKTIFRARGVFQGAHFGRHGRGEQKCESRRRGRDSREAGIDIRKHRSRARRKQSIRLVQHNHFRPRKPYDRIFSRSPDMVGQPPWRRDHDVWTCRQRQSLWPHVSPSRDQDGLQVLRRPQRLELLEDL